MILGQLDVAELFFNTFMDLKGIAETLDGRKVDFFGKSELQFGSKSSISNFEDTMFSNISDVFHNAFNQKVFVTDENRLKIIFKQLKHVQTV